MILKVFRSSALALIDHLENEANSIEYFNDNDETVLQGETQYKHAE